MIVKDYNGFLADSIDEILAFATGLIYGKRKGNYIDVQAVGRKIYPTLDKSDNKMRWRLEKIVVDDILEMIEDREEE